MRCSNLELFASSSILRSARPSWMFEHLHVEFSRTCYSSDTFKTATGRFCKQCLLNRDHATGCCESVCGAAEYMLVIDVWTWLHTFKSTTNLNRHRRRRPVPVVKSVSCYLHLHTCTTACLSVKYMFEDRQQSTCAKNAPGGRTFAHSAPR